MSHLVRALPERVPGATQDLSMVSAARSRVRLGIRRSPRRPSASSEVPAIGAFIDPQFPVDSDDVYAVQAAFDPNWQSGVPFTMVLSPEGSLIFRQEGEVDILELRRALLAHLGDSGYPGIAPYWKQ
jgi:hypothetical protein